MCTDDKTPSTNQPALYHDDVTKLLRYLDAAADHAAAQSINLANSAYPSATTAIGRIAAEGEARGLAHAHRLVTQIWEAVSASNGSTTSVETTSVAEYALNRLHDRLVADGRDESVQRLDQIENEDVTA